eukprot:6213854-Pleurochrysis_carterae.AAC.3
MNAFALTRGKFSPFRILRQMKTNQKCFACVDFNSVCIYYTTIIGTMYCAAARRCCPATLYVPVACGAAGGSGAVTSIL